MFHHKSKHAATLDLEGGQDGEDRFFLQRGSRGGALGDWPVPQLPPIRPRPAGAGAALEGIAPGSASNYHLNAGGPASASRGAAAAGSGGRSGALAVDEDDEETFFERLSNSDLVTRLGALADRVFQNYLVAVLMDVVGVLLFFFDIYTDALVVDALSKTEHRDWMIITLVFILWHYVVTAVLVTAYLKRTTTKLNVLGLEEGDSAVGGAAVLGSRRRHLWLAFVPVAVPGVVLLDVSMLFTSILPIAFPRLFVNFSSFLSNYNFSRFFIEFVFESIPQTILQTYIYRQLAKGRHAGSAEQRTIALSLTVSALNCIKYGWKLYKAADDAGLSLPEYFKYLLLLKGNYECSPSAMIAVINECCSVRKAPAPGGGAGGLGGKAGSSGDIVAAAAAAGGGGEGGGFRSARGSPGGGGGGGPGGVGCLETVFVMNGFHLHRNKSQYGPAQQAYILLNAFDRIDGCVGVRRWVISGCPLASINRILEKGIRAFRNLNTLEVNECALRGDTWKLVTRAIRKHKRLEKVKFIQTGVLTKYRNAARARVVAGLFKHSLGLRTVALCVNWWDEDHLQNVVDLYLLDHPTLESLAIELPPGAPFASRDVGAADPRVGPHDASHRSKPSSRLAAAAAAAKRSSLINMGSGNLDSLRSRLAEAAAAATANGRGGGNGGGGGAPRPRSYIGVSGPAAGFLSPFTPDASSGAGPAARAGGGGAATAAALRGWVQHGGAVLSGIASYVTDGAISTVQGLAAVATGQPWASGGGGAAAPGVASPRYCWLLAAVLTSTPALRSLYIHNHALPEAPAEGVGQLAAALAGNSLLTALSLRGSAVGDAGAAALARVLSGHNSSLQLLNLRRCQLHDEGVSALCACLVENRGLRSLDLSHNRVQGAGGVAAAGPGGGGPGGGGGGGGGSGRLAGLERALRLNTCLQELKLEGWRDTFDSPQAAASLAAALAVNEGLRSLSLAGCCLSSAGASALASALAANTCLTALDLSAAAADGATGFGAGAGAGGPEGRIGDAGVAALGAALSRNRCLRELYLAGCRCGQLGGAALREALKVNSVLQVLDLSGDGAGGGDGGGDGGGGAGAGWFGGVSGGGGGGAGSGLSTPYAAAAVAATAAAAAAAAESGVDDESATCVFTALQTNTGLRVLRMRGANRLTPRAVRAAGEMLRRNNCLLELDLSNSTFLAAADSAALAAAEPPPPPLQCSQSQPHPPSASATAAGSTASQRSSLADVPALGGPLPSSLSLPASLPSSLISSASLQREGEHRVQQQPQQKQQQPQQPENAAAAAALRRNESFASSVPRVPSVGGLTGPGSVAAGGAGGGGGVEGGLSAEAWEVVGAMWSSLAGGLAANGRLRVLRLSYCGLGSVGAAALVPALMQNTALQELDLAGLPAATARIQLAAVIAKAATCMATAPGAAAAGGGDTSVFTPVAAPSPTPRYAAGGGAFCSLTSIRATDESYEVVDLLGASKVTSRAAEEAAAAAEEARRAPRRLRGGGDGGGSKDDGGGTSLLLDEGGGGGRGGGNSSGGGGAGRGRGWGWGWRWWRR